MVRFELVSGKERRVFVLQWGELRQVRSADPTLVYVVAPAVATGVSAGGESVPLLRDVSGVTAATKLEGGSVIGPIRLEVKAQGQLPVRLDAFLPAPERALEDFLRSIRLAEIALPRIRGGFVYLDSTGTPRTCRRSLSLVAGSIKDHARLIATTCRSIDENPHRSTIHALPGHQVHRLTKRRHETFLFVGPTYSPRVRLELSVPPTAHSLQVL